MNANQLRLINLIENLSCLFLLKVVVALGKPHELNNIVQRMRALLDLRGFLAEVH